MLGYLGCLIAGAVGGAMIVEADPQGFGGLLGAFAGISFFGYLVRNRI